MLPYAALAKGRGWVRNGPRKSRERKLEFRRSWHRTGYGHEREVKRPYAFHSGRALRAWCKTCSAADRAVSCLSGVTLLYTTQLCRVCAFVSPFSVSEIQL